MCAWQGSRWGQGSQPGLPVPFAAGTRGGSPRAPGPLFCLLPAELTLHPPLRPSGLSSRGPGDVAGMCLASAHSCWENLVHLPTVAACPSWPPTPLPEPPAHHPTPGATPSHTLAPRPRPPQLPVPAQTYPCSMLQAGGVKGSSAGQVPSPQPGRPPGRAAVPARGESQGLCRPPAGAQMAAGVHGDPGLPLPPPTSAVCHHGKPTLGRVPGGRVSLKRSPPRRTAASGPGRLGTYATWKPGL